MIPVLLESIKELKRELNEFKNTSLKLKNEKKYK